MNEDNSIFIKKAQKILSEAKSFSSEEVKENTIKLAGYILQEANRINTPKEKKRQEELSRMVKDPTGKAFLTMMTDQCFRSTKSKRIANQLVFLLYQMGIPKFVHFTKKIALTGFRYFGKKFSSILVPLAMHFLRKETSTVIIPGERHSLSRHIKKRNAEHVRLNLNHLGEAILGEEEAKSRLDVYLEDLKQDDIDYVSIKISTIYSQINLLSWDETLEALSDKLRTLYRAAMKKGNKFVNLDMEEYKDMHLTKELFFKVLSEKEFMKLRAGIVLQAYLPDAHLIQQEITAWAKERVQKGGASVKIRVVKGANMVMEQFEASLMDWEQAPYQVKLDTDANYKKMIEYGLLKENAEAVELGIASHNIFDIAYAMLLRVRNDTEKYSIFEMLEGMADHMRKVVHKLTGSILLYCAVAKKEDFQSAIAYLTRRLDENTGVDNFLSQSFGLEPNSPSWKKQTDFFLQSLEHRKDVFMGPRRVQDRSKPPKHLPLEEKYHGESDTDFALPQNATWVGKIVQEYREKSFPKIPLIINGEEIHGTLAKGKDPSAPKETLYEYTLGTTEDVDKALSTAKEAEASWSNTPVEKRCEIMAKMAKLLRENRGHLIGIMMRDGGKTVFQSDPEISEAIDFCEYYLRRMRKLAKFEDVSFSPKGTVLVTPPWNFPCAIPIGGVVAALITGNTVLFKPAPETVLVGYEVCKLFYEAGVPKDVLQFINVEDDPVGSELIKDKRVNSIILTGATSTAKLFQKMHPGIHLCAETGGKNAMIVTGLSDRDLAIKEIINGAFGHSGQKCSATSLAILEKEVYEDPSFLKHLKDAAESLKVGPATKLSSKVTPLIGPASQTFQKGFEELAEGESWLLKPKQDKDNPQLYSPGIKMGVKKGSFSHLSEFFGPILCLMKAEDLDDAIFIANSTQYGLTSGLQSLDTREQEIWADNIIAGNLYINRSTTGAIVARQPFGGCKNSSFGHGSKAGGPNYLLQFMDIEQKEMPKEKHPFSDWVAHLSKCLENFNFTTDELGVWYASIANYAYFWQQLKRRVDVSKVVGQDNFLYYTPHKKMVFRIEKEDKPLDILRVFAAALTTETHLDVSWDQNRDHFGGKTNWAFLLPIFNITFETEESFLQRMRKGEIKRVRLLSPPSKEMIDLAADHACYLNDDPVLANGRIELLHYIREVSISIDYHRYGYLGLREGEPRKPIK